MDDTRTMGQGRLRSDWRRVSADDFGCTMMNSTLSKIVKQFHYKDKFNGGIPVYTRLSVKKSIPFGNCEMFYL